MTLEEENKNYETLERTDISLDDKIEIMLRLCDENSIRLEEYLVNSKFSLKDKAQILTEIAREDRWFVEGVVSRLTSKEQIDTIIRLAQEEKDEIKYIEHCITDSDMSLAPYVISYLILEIIERDIQRGAVFFADNCGSSNLSQEFKLYIVYSIAYKDVELAKQCLEFINYRTKLDIDNIFDQDDIKYQMRQKHPYFNFDEFIQKTDIMMAIFEDVEEARKQIKDSDLSFSDKVELICKIAEQDPEYAKRLYDLIPQDNNMEQITLPENMRFGIEIETEGDEEYRGKILDWKAIKDISLKNYGTEVVSPILNKDNNKDIYFICKILKAINRHTSDSCAGHIHIGADYLKTPEQWIKLRDLWKNVEEVIYIISNPEGSTIRPKAIDYARPINSQEKSVDLNNEEDVKGLFMKFKEAARYDRMWSINFSNVGEREKNTIEFRIPNSTLAPEVWIQNINLYGSILVAVKQIDEIEKASQDGKKLNGEQLKKLHLFQTILSYSEPNDEKLQILLDLIFDNPKQKQVYINRYNANKQNFWNSNIGKEFKELYKKREQEEQPNQSDGGR